MAEILQELDQFTGQACLVQHKNEFFVVSSVDAPFTGPETLVFRSDNEGNVTEWGEVAGGRGMSRTEAIQNLEARDLRSTT